MTDGLRRLGFEPDCCVDLSAETLAGARTEGSAENEERLVEYLRQGCVLAAGAGLAEDDLLDPNVRRVTSQDLLTDGHWLWDAALPYYVAKYHVRLQEEFVRDAEARGFIPPDLTHVQLVEISEMFFEQFRPFG